MNLQSLETTLKEKIVFLQEGFIDKRLANIHIADSSNRYDPKTRFHVAIDSEVFNMIEKRYEDLDRQIKWTSLSQGVCQGMSIWFLYLYFKTRASFQDPKAHIACLTNLFANQAGVEANLLQIFKLKEVLEFLDLRIDLESCESKHSLFFQGEDEFSLCSLKLQTTQNSEETENIIKQLNQLPNGAYIIRVPIHSCVYIKTENYVFFFDPSAGTVAINVDSPNYNLGLFRFLTIQAIHYENLAFNKVFNKVVEELNLSPSQANILSSSELKNMIEEITANSPNIKFIPISTAQTFYP
ncbi:MAG: hypothetical protein Q8L98_00305 [Chlamydiales bacterium]|nr:hypothetical protein [Chlamydiales bacterium]